MIRGRALTERYGAKTAVRDLTFSETPASGQVTVNDKPHAAHRAATLGRWSGFNLFCPYAADALAGAAVVPKRREA